MTILNEAAPNVHMEHVDDLLWNEGTDGLRDAINFLRNVRDMLAGGKTSYRMTQKWDGCVHHDSLLYTNYGEMTIGEIIDNIDNYDDLMVLGRDLNVRITKDVMTPVYSGTRQTGDKPWVRVDLDDGGYFCLTYDHEVHTSNRGYIKAGELKEGDDVTEV